MVAPSIIFQETKLPGVFVLEMVGQEDDRGMFVRTWCEREFARHGLNPRIVQCSASFNRKRGTLRGMHYQAAPYQEAKLVRCTAGAIYDVAIDLRRDSPTYTEWIAIELTAKDYRMLYIPEGFAHGFQTLENNTDVSYQMSEFYDPAYARGVRWDDPAFNIQWPPADRIMSSRDATYPNFVR